MLTIDFIHTHTEATKIHDGAISPDLMIDVVDFDTRRLTANSLYIALTIGQTDGHRYIEEAIQQGAVAVLISNESVVKAEWTKRVTFLVVEDTLLAFQALAHAYRKQLNIPVIGITGSNGKTTTKDIVATLLSTKLAVHKTYKNFNNHLGVPLTLLQAKRTHDVIVLEMGMNHAGELDCLGRIAAPNYVVITNIGESHIEHLGSRENIAHAKGELLPHLQENGIAFLPGDGAFHELLARKTNEKKVFFSVVSENSIHPERGVGIDEEQPIFAHHIDVREGFTFFEYSDQVGGSVERYHMPLYGEHNVRNALPAIYLAKELGLSKTELGEGLEKLRISPMRFERMLGKNNITIINDAYNASPTSMQKSSETFLNTFTSKRRVLVLGDMYELGEESLSWHKRVGEALNEHRDKVEFLITVGLDARAISGAFDGRKRHFETKEEAGKFLQVFLHEDFALFFKASRGMKLETMVDLVG